MAGDEFERRQLGQSEAQAASSSADTAHIPIGTLAGSSAAAGAQPARRGRQAGIIAAVVAAGVAVAMAASWFAQSPAPGDASLSEAAKAERAAQFQQHGPLALAGVPAAEQRQALGSMDLSAGAQAALERDLQQNGVRLVYLTLWDDQVEDGDALTIEAAGFQRTVALTKAPQRFAVPVAGGRITLRGVRDGGGGITMGAQAEGGAVLVPVLAPGQAVEVPIRIP